MGEQITYAKAGVEPLDWYDFDVIDLATGQRVLDVNEVNTTEGWLVSYRRNAAGTYYVDPMKPDEIAKRRVEGRFALRRRA
jgi:hypothetical protein